MKLTCPNFNYWRKSEISSHTTSGTRTTVWKIPL